MNPLAAQQIPIVSTQVVFTVPTTDVVRPVLQVRIAPLMKDALELAATFNAPKTESVRPVKSAYRTSVRLVADLTLTVLPVKHA